MNRGIMNAKSTIIASTILVSVIVVLSVIYIIVFNDWKSWMEFFVLAVAISLTINVVTYLVLDTFYKHPVRVIWEDLRKKVDKDPQNIGIAVNTTVHGFKNYIETRESVMLNRESYSYPTRNTILKKSGVLFKGTAHTSIEKYCSYDKVVYLEIVKDIGNKKRIVFRKTGNPRCSCDLEWFCINCDTNIRTNERDCKCQWKDGKLIT